MSRPRKLTREVLATMPTSQESIALSKDLKAWLVVHGPTTIYAFMQAMGLVNDHLHACDVHGEAARARREFKATPLNSGARRSPRRCASGFRAPEQKAAPSAPERHRSGRLVDSASLHHAGARPL